jgi:hypothetical protein
MLTVESSHVQMLDQTLARLMTSTLTSARFCESIALQFATERDNIGQCQDVLRGMVQEASGIDMADILSRSQL